MLQKGASITQAGGSALHKCTGIETHCSRAGLTLAKGTVITARGYCASPGKLYYTVKCGDVPCTIFLMCRCRIALLFINVLSISVFCLSTKNNDIVSDLLAPLLVEHEVEILILLSFAACFLKSNLIHL